MNLMLQCSLYRPLLFKQIKKMNKICYKTRCATCQLWTWGGCGQHIQQALSGVPTNQLCVCVRR